MNAIPVGPDYAGPKALPVVSLGANLNTARHNPVPGMMGKSHLACALSYATCQAGHSGLFTTAVDIINTLTAAQAACRLKAELKRFLAPEGLCVDEVGYLPIDKTGADLLFQAISQRYEHGSIILTTNQAYKHWARIFNNDSTLTSAVLDRLLHHAETVIIEGKSYRMKDQIKAP